MKILLLSGSPRIDGNSQILAKAFMEGAKEAGHQVTFVDVAKLKIGPCTACDFCRNEAHLGACSQKDDMQQIYDIYEDHDALVLATPLYYFGFAAQLKLAIDRFYAIPSQAKMKKMALLAACADVPKLMDSLVANYRAISDYLNIPSAGEVLAAQCAAKGEAREHPAYAQARDLGASF